MLLLLSVGRSLGYDEALSLYSWTGFIVYVSSAK